MGRGEKGNLTEQSSAPTLRPDRNPSSALPETYGSPSGFVVAFGAPEKFILS